MTELARKHKWEGPAPLWPDIKIHVKRLNLYVDHVHSCDQCNEFCHGNHEVSALCKRGERLFKSWRNTGVRKER